MTYFYSHNNIDTSIVSPASFKLVLNDESIEQANRSRTKYIGYKTVAVKTFYNPGNKISLLVKKER
jgi:hypothetical protein